MKSFFFVRFLCFYFVLIDCFIHTAMGVHSLWNILEPTSRAVRLESLSRKRMAVDASIWIYQFLKAVRDKSGQSLTSSHIVGFFRRICKLLFFGIQPVFVFDGGAPILKRETINKRKERRQGKRDDATKTAQRLLAIQLQKQSERKPTTSVKADVKVDDGEEYHYLEDFNGPQRTTVEPQHSQQNTSLSEKIFKSSDEYHLPHIKGFEYEKKDTRIVDETDTELYKEFSEHLDELDGIDLNTIDPASKEFENLPLTTQYMVLSQLRLRSRLRMGYTKEQLENVFPNKLDFSKFQIQMVQKRNFFTQKLMNVTGMDDSSNDQTRRIVGEKGKAYRIKKSEGGWSLSLDDDDYNLGTKSNPVDLDKEERKRKRRFDSKPFDDEHDDNEDDEDNEDWEDVSLENKEKPKISYAMNSIPLPPAETVQGAGDSTIRSFMAFSPQKKRKIVAINDEVDEENSEDEALRQFEEIELMEAVQKSKDDLKKQQEMEFEVAKELSEKTHEVGEDDVFNDIPFEMEEVKKDESIQRAPELKLRSEMDHLLGLNLNPAGNKPVESTPTNDDVRKTVSKSSESAQSAQSAPTVPKVPSWFNQTLTDPFKQQSKLSQTRKKDQDIGLVPWFEAKEILEKQQKEEEAQKEENSDRDDVVEISAPIHINLEEKDSTKNDTSNSTQNEQSIEVVDNLDNENNTHERDENENKNADDKADDTNVIDYEFYETEEEELNEILEKEEQEHEQFQKDLNPHIINTFVDNDEKQLREQKRRELRDSDEVTQEMIKEVQELLARFGIPYITAPMEAEAQCAELLKLNLVDGIITDDSDVFLFGGDRIYRNMFHEKHYVEFYSGKDVERDLGLDQLKLVSLAHLLGSDYTEGLKGIGPVNAMEVIAHFGTLENFRDWFMEGQFDLDKQNKEDKFLKNLRKKLVKNDILLDIKFPDKRVDQAYLQADVDHDKTEFVWGTPDLDRIRSFLMSTVGWSQERVDQVLVPLIRDLNKKKREGVQSTLGEFYSVEELPRKRKNKRIVKAKEKITKK